MPTPDELEYERHEARVKYQRDEKSRLSSALEQGRKEGAVRRVQFCQELLGQTVSSEEQLLALPLSELESLANQREAKLRQRVAQWNNGGSKK